MIATLYINVCVCVYIYTYIYAQNTAQLKLRIEPQQEPIEQCPQTMPCIVKSDICPQIVEKLFTYVRVRVCVCACVCVYLIFFLLKVNGAQTIPGVVVSIICPQCTAEACHGFVEVFIAHVLMASKSVRIREGRINLPWCIPWYIHILYIHTHTHIYHNM